MVLRDLVHRDYVYFVRVPRKVKNTRLTYLFRRNTLPLSSIVKFRGVNKRSKRKWKLKEHQWDLIDSINRLLCKKQLCFCHLFFLSFRYPVILSLENHCSVSQQKVMAKLLRDIFKDILF